MGFHLIKGDLLDRTVDPAQPEALVYAPDKHGKLKLVAVEYVVFQERLAGGVRPRCHGADALR